MIYSLFVPILISNWRSYCWTFPFWCWLSELFGYGTFFLSLFKSMVFQSENMTCSDFAIRSLKTPPLHLNGPSLCSDLLCFCSNCKIYCCLYRFPAPTSAHLLALRLLLCTCEMTALRFLLCFLTFYAITQNCPTNRRPGVVLTNEMIVHFTSTRLLERLVRASTL